jgi:hypothetical protein
MSVFSIGRNIHFMKKWPILLNWIHMCISWKNAIYVRSRRTELECDRNTPISQPFHMQKIHFMENNPIQLN